MTKHVDIVSGTVPMMDVKSALRRLLPPFISRRQRAMPGFDREFYLQQNVDLREAAIEPLEHFMIHGWSEKRDPSKGFSVVDYLDANPDVREAGVNPLVHYVEHGIAEGRPLRPDHRATSPFAGAPLVAPGSGNDARIAYFHTAPPGRRGRLV